MASAGCLSLCAVCAVQLALESETRAYELINLRVGIFAAVHAFAIIMHKVMVIFFINLPTFIVRLY